MNERLAAQAAAEAADGYRNPSDFMAAKGVGLAAIERYCELVSGTDAQHAPMKRIDPHSPAPALDGGDHTSTLHPDYKVWYERGWRYSGRETATLDHGDAIGAPDAWYDGYLDRAAGRNKWHLAPTEGDQRPVREDDRERDRP